jgi:hypothetical protein
MLNQVKYLDSINDFPKAGLIYFENSGEKLLKYYLEQIFKINIGTNTANDILENYWIVSSDYPLRNHKYYKEVNIASAIIVIRNPVDVIMSNVLNSDDIDDAIENVDQLIQQWKEFYRYWTNAPIPVFIVRYEDLIISTEEILLQVARFLLGAKSMENSKLEYFVRKAIGSNPNKELYAYDIELEDDRILNSQTLNMLKTKFMSLLYKTMEKFNYEVNKTETDSNWLLDFNKDNLVRAVDFHEFLDNQILISNYITMKLC